MKKVTIKAPESKPDVEKARRVYRSAVEIIRRHDEIIKQKRAYRDVFLPEAILLRDRLQEYCEKIMFYSPGEYGRKAEEILWRKAFYEIIQLMKCNKKHVTPNSLLENAYRTHLTSAMGYYHHLLCRLQSEFDLNLEGVVDFYYLPEPKARRKLRSLKTNHSVEVQRWALQACHRCLIYLGDLARYQHDYDGMPSKVLAQRYYYQAMTLCPDDGMPSNQLGTLAGGSYYGLNAAYYYIRCLVCPVPFDGARSNLVTLFERNRKRFADLNLVESSAEVLSPEQQRSKDIKRFVSRFLQLLDIFYTKSQSLDAKGIQDVCQNALHDFNLCMFSQSSNAADIGVGGSHSCEDKPCHLSDEIVFKIFVICLAMIHIMQKEGNKLVAAAIAFSLALFSHALNHTMMRLQTALYELENPPRKFNSLTPDELSSCADVEESQENCFMSLPKRKNSIKGKKHVAAKHHAVNKVNGKDTEDLAKNDKKKLKKSSKLRRMRRRKGSGSTSGSEGNSDGSEDELKDIESEESDTETTFQVIDCTLSSSDSDDNLMVSQELRPGFSSVSSDMVENSDEPTDSERHLDMAMDVLGGTITEIMSNNDNKSNRVHHTPDPVPRRKQSIADMTEYLQDISLDWLSDAANLLHQTLQFSYRTPDSNGHDGFDNQNISAVIQGTKQVRIPPGFETSNEQRYVMEISEKLANFEIETDTDISVCLTDAENSTVTESEMDTETETDRSELHERKLERLIEVATREGLLCSIKVYCDWLRTNPHVIATCAKISSSIWYRLSVLLNFLPSESDMSKRELCGSEAIVQLIQSAQTSNDWVQHQPLTEDLHLRRFSALDVAHKDLVPDVLSRLDLSARQQAILRICYLRRFGYFIARLKSVRFTFSKDSGMFYGPQHAPSLDIVSDRKAEQDLVNAEARRNQLMKDMAQLRLKAEVSQLEGSLKSTDAQPKMPPYLVPDALSLCDHLNLMKQLAASSRFIVIIPISVVDHLDFLKKDVAGAREAIRWLEIEFQKGNRFVRAQKAHENNLSGQQKFMKKDKDLWRAVQIIDCCKYLSKQNPNCDLRSMVTLLTKIRVATSSISIRAKEVIAKAVDEGLTVQTVPELYAKWKETWKTDKG